MKSDFPYVLPGPDDTWGGTWGTAGWRTHDVNILFKLDEVKRGNWKLVVDLVDSAPTRSVVKVKVNDKEKKFEIKGGSADVLKGDLAGAKGHVLELPLEVCDLKAGGNQVTVSVLEGGWIVFDQVRLEAPASAQIGKMNPDIFLRNVSSASYEIESDGKRCQPLLVDVEHLSGNPVLSVKLDGTVILSEQLDTARYVFEAPMPAVAGKKKSTYQVFADNELIEEGKVMRSPQTLQTYADYVDTKLGTAHSRWMIAPGPWMPFSMVK